MRDTLKCVSLFITALCFATSAGAAVDASKAKLKKTDIAEILERHADENVLIVKTYEGKKFRLKVTDEQWAEIENAVKVASADGKVAATVLNSQASSSTAAPAAGQSAASVEEIKKDVKKSPWGASYFGWYISDPLDKVHALEGKINFRNYFTIKYTLDNGIALSLRPRIDIDYNLEQGNAKNSVMDTGIGVSKGGFKLPADIGLLLDGRVYLPTSYGTKKKGTNASLYGKAVLTKSVGKIVDLSYAIVPIYYLQGNRSIANFDELGGVVGEATGTFQAIVAHGLTIEEKITDKLTLSQDLIGFTHYLTYDDPGVGAVGGTKTDFEPGLGIAYNFTDKFNASFNLSQTHEISDGKGIALFDATRTQYHIQTTLTF